MDVCRASRCVDLEAGKNFFDSMREYICPQYPWRIVIAVRCTSTWEDKLCKVSGCCIASMNDGKTGKSACVARQRSRHSIADFADQIAREAGNDNLSSVNEIRGGFWSPIDACVSCMKMCRTSL